MSVYYPPLSFMQIRAERKAGLMKVYIIRMAQVDRSWKSWSHLKSVLSFPPICMPRRVARGTTCRARGSRGRTETWPLELKFLNPGLAITVSRRIMTMEIIKSVGGGVFVYYGRRPPSGVTGCGRGGEQTRDWNVDRPWVDKDGNSYISR